MKKYRLFLFLSLLIYSHYVVSQNNDWSLSTIKFLEDKISKTEGSVRYFVDPLTSINERKNVVKRTKEYIKYNLELLKESEFTDSVYVILVRSKDEMIKYTGRRISGITFFKDLYIPQNMVFSTPQALKHELMHILVYLKWSPLIEDNEVKHPDWLDEGLAVCANPEAEELNNITLKDMYAYFYQNNKLLNQDSLTVFPSIESPRIKIAYIQSGYIVHFLIEKYGIEKIKKLWIGNSDFESIYGINLKNMIQKINKEIEQKYLTPIKFNSINLNKNDDF